MKGFLVAGTASGVGKTTVTLTLLAAMRRRGMTVQSFKGGPDFLDTGHHTRIAGRTARNLDTWMLSAEANQDALYQNAQGADAFVVEGMMGLFDGKDGITGAGSSAEIAKLLKLPVVLVLDAGKTARSIAAVVLGFELFDPELVLAGIILNRVASERHYRMLESAITSSCRTPLLGWIPREPLVAIPERHLGLRTVEESDASESLEKQTDILARLAENHLNLNALLCLECDLAPLKPEVRLQQKDGSHVRIGVARDQAFSFYYEDNLDLLRRHGAEIIPFSPLLDRSLPANLDALYLGGGYPELYARQLSSNKTMLASIRDFANSDRPVYAECGGMIYLARCLTTTDGEKHPMVGVLPFAMEMTSKLVKFGYVTVELTQDCLLGAEGMVVRGHSFHYSRMVDLTSDIKTSYSVSYSLSGQHEEEGYSVGNTLASYVHLHFGAAPAMAQRFVELTRRVKVRELTAL